MYGFLGITLVLAMLLTVNVVATATAVGSRYLLRRPLGRCTARTRAELLFALRIGPPAIAFIWIAAFMTPSYLLYEPHSTGESVSKKLGIIAVISAIGVGCAIWSGIRSWLATRSLLKTWLANSQPIEIGLDVPAFLLRHSFPIIAVVGTFRPRLFIAECVLESLSEEELSAAITHECGHMAAHDNLKRSLLRASRAGLMIFPCGRSLDRAWADAAEAAADEHAAQQSSAVALNLASALVRIARMIPPDSQMLPSPAYLVGVEETCGVKARVSRLIELSSFDPSMLVSSAPILRLAPWLLSVLVIGVVITESRLGVLAAVHAFIEHVVAF